jgi:hypothetical protein
MNRNLQSDDKSRTNENANRSAPASPTLAPWTRRQFLANSSGLAIAGAIGGLVTQLPASAHEPACSENAHPAARNEVTHGPSAAHSIHTSAARRAPRFALAWTQ